MLGLDFKAQGRHEFVLRVMESLPIHTNVKDTGAKAFVDKNMVNHVTSSRTITISEPCSFVKEHVLKPGVGNDQLITSTEVQQSLPIFVALSNTVGTND